MKIHSYISKAKVIGVFLSISLLTSNLFGAIKTSAGSGNWNTPGTWTPSGVPGNTDVVTIQSGHTVTLDISTNNLTSLTINSGGQLNTTSAFTVSATNIVVNGIYLNGSTGTITGTMSVNAGGTYQHNINSGSIPTATWNATSTCSITGITNGVPTVTTFNQNFGNFIWNCTGQSSGADLSLIGNLTSVAGNLSILSTGGGSLRLANGGVTSTVNVGGDFTNSGSFYICGTSNACTITLNISGNCSLTAGRLDLNGNSGTGTLNIRKNFNLSGSAVLTESGSGSGVVNFNGNSIQTLIRSGGTINNSVSFNILNGSIVDFGATNYIDGASASFNLNAGGTLITGNANGINAWWPLNVGSIQVGGTRTYNGSANYIYNGTVAQVTGNGLSNANNLTINNPTGVTLTNNTNVQGLILTKGIVFSTSGTLLSVQNTAGSAVSGGAADTYVDGPLKRALPMNLSSGSTYSFPVGKGGTYLPFDLVNPVTNQYTNGEAQVEAFNTGCGGTATAPLTSLSSTEYWQVSNYNNITSTSVSVYRQTAISPLNSIAGSTSKTGSYSALGGSLNSNSIINSMSIGSNRFFSLAKGNPTISVTGTPLTAFTYKLGDGPSAEQQITVSGICLDGNILITPPSNFEISLGTGAFTAQPFIILPVVTNVVSPTVVRIRMKAGITPAGSVASQNIVLSSLNATSINVTCSGTIGAGPVIAFDNSTLSGFNYVFTQGPSTYLDIYITAKNLSEDIILGPCTDYEFSTNGTNYYPSLTISKSDADLNSIFGYAVHIRLRDALSVGSHNETLTAKSTSATASATLSGVVYPRSTIITSTSVLYNFVYSNGAGPSGAQTFLVSGTNLINDVALQAPTNYEISKDNTNWYTTLNYTPTSGTLSSSLVYVRLAASLSPGTYGSASSPLNIAITSTGTPVGKNVAVTGIVTSAETVLIAHTSLDKFGYQLGNGANSIIQKTTVSGGSLSNDITVTAPSNYEISTSIGGTYYSSLTLTKIGTSVDATIIYMRIVSGKGVATYSGNLTATSGTTTKNLALSGEVYNPPSITASSGSPYCAGNTISLSCVPYVAINQYWFGPNSFYSVQQNPTVTTNAQPIHSGTYTVVGSYLTGPNLAYNGDFEQGNSGFSSKYAYATPALNCLWDESKYSVCPLPSSCHANFASCADHTGGSPRNQMVVNGAGTKGHTVWCQSIPVKQNTVYQFSYWVQSVDKGSDASPARLQLYVNGIAAGPIYTAIAAECSWAQFTYNHNTGSDTYANLELINQNLAPSGNDFALDDIVYREAVEVRGTTDIVVNPAYTATLSLSVSKNPITPGTFVTFTATPGNAGPSPTYQWKVNSTVITGLTSDTYTTTTLNNGDIVTCTLTPTGGCPGSNTPSASITMTVAPNSNFWVGTTDNDWSKTTNWSKGIVPPAGDDVEFATVANNSGNAAQKDLFVDNERTIGRLINTSSQRIIIPPSKTLVINNLANTGTNADLIQIQSDPTHVNGSLVFLQPSINQNVYATVQMYSKAFYNLGLPAGSRYAWQFFGIPIQSVQADPTFYGSYVRVPDETGTTTANHWVQLNNYSILNKFQGYEICQAAPTTVFFKGPLVTSDFNSGKLNYTSTARFPGQYLFANSYTAAIDIKKLTSAFGTNIENSVYLYNSGSMGNWTGTSGETSSGTSPGQYTVSTPATAGSAGIPATIPSMQAFLVKVKSDDPNNSILSFNYKDVIVKNSEMQRINKVKVDAGPTKSYLNIVINGNKFSDRMWIFEDTTCTRSFDKGWDGPKMKGVSLCPQLYAVEKDGEYQIDAVSRIEGTTIAFEPGEDSNYTLSFAHENLTNKYKNIYLLDMVANKVVDITDPENASYSFTANSQDSVTVNRFKIITQTVEDEKTGDEALMKIFYNNETLCVANFTHEDGDLKIYDLYGRLVGISPIVKDGITKTKLVKAQQVYVVKAQTANHKKTTTILAQ